MTLKSAMLLDSSMMKTNMTKNFLIMRRDIHISTDFRLQPDGRDLMKVFISKDNRFEQDSVTLNNSVCESVVSALSVHEFELMGENQYNYRKTVLDVTDNSQQPSSKTTEKKTKRNTAITIEMYHYKI